MSNLAQIFASVVASGVLGSIAFVIVAIFGPLLFPSSLTDSAGESTVVSLMTASLLLFGVLGGVLCWRITQRWAREE